MFQRVRFCNHTGYSDHLLNNMTESDECVICCRKPDKKAFITIRYAGAERHSNHEGQQPGPDNMDLERD